MVIMALDHVRDYFHASAFFFDPADPEQSNLTIFFTRWITHFCAPAFSLLAGTSAYMVGRRKSKKELSTFLITRGLWLVFIELTIVNFAWFFNIKFELFALIVIWSLGISMLYLAALIHLPNKYILISSCILIFGHNLLDSISFEGNIFWAILHEQAGFSYDSIIVFVGYPIIPWIAVMSLGYYLGSYYDSTVSASKRKKIFIYTGLVSIFLFLVLRYTNVYGNPTDYVRYDTFTKNIISFFNPEKYPPSLQYLLMTLGPSLLFLAIAENWKGRVVNFFSTFGRVPFFYYILHIYLIHLLAMLFAELTGFGWEKLILSFWITLVPEMRGYGFSLEIVYLVWIAIIIILYPLCRKFDKYKMLHKDKKWLSYL